MRGSHISHRHGLKSAYAAIIPHIGAGKASHGVSYVLNTELGYVLTAERLHSHSCRHSYRRPPGRDCHLANLLLGAGRDGVGQLGAAPPLDREKCGRHK